MRRAIMRRDIRPHDLIEVACEACAITVFRTTAKRVKKTPAAEHLALLRAYEDHRSKTGKSCKAPPFEFVLEAARVTEVRFAPPARRP
jgi:hypothetical protein